jgi:hypothetical protein
MTEAEWLAVGDAQALLNSARQQASRRKLLLFGAGCCRLLRPWFAGLGGTYADCVDHVADDLTGGIQEHDRIDLCYAEVFIANPRHNPMLQQRVDHRRPVGKGRSIACRVPVGELIPPSRIVHILRDIFGNPFRPVTVDPSWLRWNDATIPRIAQHIYEERAFGRLPILHDALLDAGCDDEDVLAHCRSDGPHVRGCWVIDLILGKE